MFWRYGVEGVSKAPLDWKLVEWKLGMEMLPALSMVEGAGILAAPRHPSSQAAADTTHSPWGVINLLGRNVPRLVV